MLLGRNSKCWCGSGEKYKKCHMEFDEKLKEYAKAGYQVPTRDMIKNAEQIEKIKESAKINTAVLDEVAKHIKPGMTTEEINTIVHNFEEADRLVKVTKECMEMAIANVKPWIPMGIIGATIQEHAHKNGYTVVRDFGGHGIGVDFHEDPFVFHYGNENDGVLMVPGMTFTIEPMINEGGYELYIDQDNEWTSYTDDGKLSAQWENMILVTEDGCEILTY